MRQAETRALKKKNTEKLKSSPFYPHLPSGDSTPSNTDRIRTPNIQIRANLGNLGVKLRQQTTASDVVNKGIVDGHAQKENSHTTEDKTKGNNYNYFSEALHGDYEGEQKTGEYEESDA